MVCFVTANVKHLREESPVLPCAGHVWQLQYLLRMKVSVSYSNKCKTPTLLSFWAIHDALTNLREINRALKTNLHEPTGTFKYKLCYFGACVKKHFFLFFAKQEESKVLLSEFENDQIKPI